MVLMIFGVAVSSFVSGDLDAQTVSLLFSDVEGITPNSFGRPDGWILDGCSCRNEEIMILCLHHLVGVILERDVSQRHCTDQSFLLRIWMMKNCAMRLPLRADASSCLVCTPF